MKKGFLFGLIVCIAVSCSDSNSVPRGILSKEKMQNILWDMIDAGEFLDTYALNKDSVDKVAQSSRVYGQVFQVYHITREEFDKSYTYYRQHPSLMKTILDTLSKRQAISLPAVAEPGQHPDSLNKQHVDSLNKQHFDSLKKQQAPTPPVTVPVSVQQRRDSLKNKRRLFKER
jgi:Domain of unknown function (DUF4296)